MIYDAFKIKINIRENNRIRLKSDNSAVELGGANFFDRALFLTLTVFLNINATVSMHLGSTIYRKGINKNLRDKMMETIRAGSTNIHAGAFTYRLKSL